MDSNIDFKSKIITERDWSQTYQSSSWFFHQLTRNQEPDLQPGDEAGWGRGQSWTGEWTFWRSQIARIGRTHTIFSEKTLKSHFMVCSLSAIRWRLSSVIEIFPSNLKVLQLILIMHYQELKVTFKTCQNFNNFKIFTKMHLLASGSCEVTIPTADVVIYCWCRLLAGRRWLMWLWRQSRSRHRNGNKPVSGLQPPSPATPPTQQATQSVRGYSKLWSLDKQLSDSLGKFSSEIF